MLEGALDKRINMNIFSKASKLLNYRIFYWKVTHDLCLNKRAFEHKASKDTLRLLSPLLRLLLSTTEIHCTAPSRRPLFFQRLVRDPPVVTYLQRLRQRTCFDPAWPQPVLCPVALCGLSNHKPVDGAIVDADRATTAPVMGSAP